MKVGAHSRHGRRSARPGGTREDCLPLVIESLYGGNCRARRARLGERGRRSGAGDDPRRLLTLIPVLLIVSFIVFSLTALIPGDAAQTLAGGPDAQPGAVEKIRHELELDEPFLVQYGNWLGNVVQGDLGTSLYSQKPITEEIAERLPVTFSLALITLLFAIPLALLFGILGGLRPSGDVRPRPPRGDQPRHRHAVVSRGALLLISVFAVQLHWLPPFGYVQFGESPLEWFRHLILPATALALTDLGGPVAPAARRSRRHDGLRRSSAPGGRRAATPDRSSPATR